MGFDEPFRNRETEADSAMVIALRLPEIVEEVLEILLGPHQSAARISTVTTRIQGLSLSELLIAAAGPYD